MTELGFELRSVHPKVWLGQSLFLVLFRSSVIYTDPLRVSALPLGKLVIITPVSPAVGTHYVRGD